MTSITEVYERPARLYKYRGTASSKDAVSLAKNEHADKYNVPYQRLSGRLIDKDRSKGDIEIRWIIVVEDARA